MCEKKMRIYNNVDLINNIQRNQCKQNIKYCNQNYSLLNFKKQNIVLKNFCQIKLILFYYILFFNFLFKEAYTQNDSINLSLNSEGRNISLSKSPGLDAPNIVRLKTIYTPHELYNNLLKIRSNQKFIVRLSTKSVINIWSASPYLKYANIRNLTLQKGLFINQNLPFIDFNLDPSNDDILGILTKKSLYLYDINTSLILNKYQNDEVNSNCILCLWKQTILTNNFITILRYDNKIIRYSRSTQTQFQRYEPTFQSLIKMQICQNLLKGEYHVLWSQYNQVHIYQCIMNNQCNLMKNYTIKLLNNSINRVQFSKDCNFLYIQRDTINIPEIYNLFENKSQAYIASQPPIPTNQTIYSFGPVDYLNTYSIVTLSNNTIIMYRNWPQQDNLNNLTINSSHFIKLYNNSTISFVGFVDSDRYKQLTYLGFKNAIRIYSFVCQGLKFLNSNQLCEDCANNCFQCNNTDGKCLICINDRLFIDINGICQIKYESTQSRFLIEHLLAQSLIQTSNDLFPILKIIFIIIKSLPFGPFLIYFINYWQFTPFYLLLNSKTPNYVQQILKKLHDSINAPIFASLEWKKSFFINAIEKIPENLSIKYNISSNFLIMNFDSIIFMFINYGVLLLSYFIKQKFVNKKSLIYKRLNFNYNFLIFGQFCLHSTSFIINFSIIIKNLQQNAFNQKINIIFVLISFGILLLIPIFMIIAIGQKSLNLLSQQQLNLKKNQNNVNKNINIILKQAGKIQNIIQNIKLEQQSNHNQLIKIKKQWIYLSTLHIIYPCLISLSFQFSQNFQSFQSLFYFLILFLLIYQLYSLFSYNQKYQFHYFMIQIYRLIFHVCFIFIWYYQKRLGLSQKEKLQIKHQSWYHISSILAVLLIFCGGLHQILVLSYDIFWMGYRIFRKYTLINLKSQNQLNQTYLQDKQYTDRQIILKNMLKLKNNDLNRYSMQVNTQGKCDINLQISNIIKNQKIDPNVNQFTQIKRFNLNYKYSLNRSYLENLSNQSNLKKRNNKYFNKLSNFRKNKLNETERRPEQRKKQTKLNQIVNSQFKKKPKIVNLDEDKVKPLKISKIIELKYGKPNISQ